MLIVPVPTITVGVISKLFKFTVHTEIEGGKSLVLIFQNFSSLQFIEFMQQQMNMHNNFKTFQVYSSYR